MKKGRRRAFLIREKRLTLINPTLYQVLPDSLTDAIAQAAASTAAALDAGARRAAVELQLPEFWDAASGAVFAEAGDAARFWKLTRRFAADVGAAAGGAPVVALYPDAGTAAMLCAQWPDAPFTVRAVTDRNPLENTPPGAIVVLAAPDPPSLASCVRVADAARAAADAGDDGAPAAVVLFNARLVSGDVGIGLTVRRLRDDFLSTFPLTYALRPIGDVGTVFRRWPDPWRVFVADPASPGRYKLAAERDVAPVGDALDLILDAALSGRGGGGGGGGVSGDGPAVDPSDQQLPGLGDQVASAVRGLQRFMRQLSQ